MIFKNVKKLLTINLGYFSLSFIQRISTCLKIPQRKTLIIFNLRKTIKKATVQSMMLSDVTSGLRETGISPYKAVIFTNYDSVSAFVINRPGWKISRKDKTRRKSKRLKLTAFACI
jgi:hypothetical protein